MTSSEACRGVLLTLDFSKDEQSLGCAHITLNANGDLVSHIMANAAQVDFRITSDGCSANTRVVRLGISGKRYAEDHTLFRTHWSHLCEVQGNNLGELICSFGYELIGYNCINGKPVVMYMFVPIRWSSSPGLAAVQEACPEIAVMQIVAMGSYGGYNNCQIQLGAPPSLSDYVMSRMPWVKDNNVHRFHRGRSLCLLDAFEKPRLAAKQCLLSLFTSFGYRLVTTFHQVLSDHQREEYTFTNAAGDYDFAAIRVLREEMQAQSQEQARLVAQQGLDLLQRNRQNESLRVELADLQGQLITKEGHVNKVSAEVEVLQSQLQVQTDRLQKIDVELSELRRTLQDQASELEIQKRDSAQVLDQVQEAHAKEVAAMHTRIIELQHTADMAAKSPKVIVKDMGNSSRIIRIECPGVDEDAISIDRLPNGVRVCINGEGRCESFEQEFHYDYKMEGHFNLREDEVSLENGVLLLVLDRSPPRRMKLQRAQHPRACSTTLMPLPEGNDTTPGLEPQSLNDRIVPQQSSSPSEDGVSIGTESSVWIKVAHA